MPGWHLNVRIERSVTVSSCQYKPAETTATTAKIIYEPFIYPSPWFCKLSLPHCLSSSEIASRPKSHQNVIELRRSKLFYTPRPNTKPKRFEIISTGQSKSIMLGIFVRFGPAPNTESRSILNYIFFDLKKTVWYYVRGTLRRVRVLVKNCLVYVSLLNK